MDIELCLFPGGVRRALTMSFDDGREFDVPLAELFDRYGIKGTFHLNSGNLNKDGYLTDEQVRQIGKKHEISVHGRTHPFLDKIPLPFAIQEVLEDKQYLEQFTDVPVRGMSYPYGTYNDGLIEVLKATGMEYSRTINNTKSFYLPEDFMKWHPTCHHSSDIFALWDKFMKFNKHIRLFYIWGHSYEFDRDQTWERMEEFCRLAGGSEDVWYATSIELKDYITAMRGLVFTADRKKVYNPSAVEVWFKADGEKIKVLPGECRQL